MSQNEEPSRLNTAPIRMSLPASTWDEDMSLVASPTGKRLASPTLSESLRPIDRVPRPFVDRPLKPDCLGKKTLATTQTQRPRTALGADDAKLLQSLRGRPLENIWLESRLTIQTAKQNDETAQLKSILKSAFFPTKRQAARQRRRAVRVKHGVVHSNTCSMCSADSRVSYHSRYCKACKKIKCNYCGVTSVTEEMLDGQCGYCLTSNSCCASRMPMRRLGLLLLDRRPQISSRELLDALCNYGRNDAQVGLVNAELRVNPLVLELRAEVDSLRQTTEHLRELLPMSLEEATDQLKDMGQMLQRQVNELCAQMDVVTLESERNMSGLAMLRNQKENIAIFLTGIKEQVNRLRYQERPNLDELRVHLLDINKHIDNFNEAFIEVSNQQSTTVSAINGLRSVIRDTIKESQASEVSMTHRTSRLHSLLPADVLEGFKPSAQRRRSSVASDGDESLASSINSQASGRLSLLPPTATQSGAAARDTRASVSSNARRRTSKARPGGLLQR